MTEPRRFDPVGWFFSMCLTVMGGVIALVVAVHLLEIIRWWLLGAITLAMVIGVGVFVGRIWWHRRNPW